MSSLAVVVGEFFVVDAHAQEFFPESFPCDAKQFRGFALVAASCQAVCSGTGSVLRLVWCRCRVFVSIRLLRFPFFFFILRSIP